MKILYLIPAILLFFALCGSIYYFYFISRLKTKNRVLGAQIDKITEKFKAEGLDKYYESLSSEKLIREHKRILDAYDEVMDNSEKLAELSCKENFISEILNARGIDIDELVKKHLGTVQETKIITMEKIKIVSIKWTTIFSIILGGIIMLAVIMFLSYTLYAAINAGGLDRKLLFAKENLFLALFLIVSIYAMYGVFQILKMNTYSVQMDEYELIYKFLFKKVIPYSKISRIQLLKHRARNGAEQRSLIIFIDNRPVIVLRLDHLNINRFDDIIRPRPAYYLKGEGNEDMILNFICMKTGKEAEKKESWF